MYPKYEEDRCEWIRANTNLLKQGLFEEVDMEHIIEELEMGNKSDKRGLRSHLGVLIAHLLKWYYQPDYQDKRSWKKTIITQRFEIISLLEESPSLKSSLTDMLPKAYKYACSIVETETPIDLKILPKECPYTFEQCLDEEFYPE